MGIPLALLCSASVVVSVLAKRRLTSTTCHRGFLIDLFAEDCVWSVQLSVSTDLTLSVVEERKITGEENVVRNNPLSLHRVSPRPPQRPRRQPPGRDFFICCSKLAVLNNFTTRAARAGVGVTDTVKTSTRMGFFVLIKDVTVGKQFKDRRRRSAAVMRTVSS